MNKKVSCSIYQRCKCIKFTSDKNTPDLFIVKKKIQEVCERDEILRDQIKNKVIIIQRIDNDLNMWCDIDEDDTICDKDHLNVLLLSKNSTLIEDNNIPVEPKKEVLIISDASNKKPSIKRGDDPVNYDEPYIDNDDKPIAETEKNEKFEHLMETNIVKKLHLINNADSILKHTPGGPGCIKNPAVLPGLTFDLERKLKEKDILAYQKDFIFHWGVYLNYMTHGRPTKNDFKNLASSIVSSFPKLADADGGYTIVKQQLSMWMRNHRYYEKKQAMKRNYEGQTVNGPSTSKANSFSEEEQRDNLTSNDISRVLDDLEKTTIRKTNFPYPERSSGPGTKKWNQKSTQTLSEVLEKYPRLKEYDLVIFEFYKLQGLQADIINENINNMFTKLGLFYNVSQDNETDRIFILSKLSTDLTLRSKNLVHYPLFAVQDVPDSHDILLTELNESPRAVIYKDDNYITECFIVANQNIIMRIPVPTINNAIIALIACYFVWEAEYPKGYTNILTYFDRTILERDSTKVSTTVLKFIRSCEVNIKNRKNYEMHLDN